MSERDTTIVILVAHEREINRTNTNVADLMQKTAVVVVWSHPIATIDALSTFPRYANSIQHLLDTCASRKGFDWPIRISPALPRWISPSIVRVLIALFLVG